MPVRMSFPACVISAPVCRHSSLMIGTAQVLVVGKRTKHAFVSGGLYCNLTALSFTLVRPKSVQEQSSEKCELLQNDSWPTHPTKMG